jgi:hypothetical protein
MTGQWTETGYAVRVEILPGYHTSREIPLAELRAAHEAHQARRHGEFLDTARPKTLQQRIQDYFGLPSRDALVISRRLREEDSAHATSTPVSTGEGLTCQV